MFGVLDIEETEHVTSPMLRSTLSRDTVGSTKDLDEFHKTYLILIYIVRKVCVLEECVSKPAGLSDS